MIRINPENDSERDAEDQRALAIKTLLESGVNAPLLMAQPPPIFESQRGSLSRLNHLYRISQLLVKYETLETALESVFATIRSALPIRSVILIEEMADRPVTVRTWTSEELPFDEFLAAGSHAEAMHDYFQRSGSSLDRRCPNQADQNFIVMPLAVDHRTVLGTFQLECMTRFDEADVRFVSAIANQLAIALDLHNARQREKEAIRRLNEFTGVAAHDLKSPIHVILAFSDLIHEDMHEDDPNKKYLENIIRAGQRMNQLINDLLDLSRATSGRIDFAIIDAAEMAHEVWRDMKPNTDEKKAELRVAPLPPLSAGRFQVRQLLQNLIGNAIKYSNPDVPPLINISGRIITKRNKPFVEVSIADNGIGFDPTLADKIFEPFERLYSADEYEGDGLGLAICRKIVERHGGTIIASSRKGQGSTFTFTLPAAHQETDPIN